MDSGEMEKKKDARCFSVHFIDIICILFSFLTNLAIP